MNQNKYLSRLLPIRKKLKRLSFQDRCVSESLNTLTTERGVLLKLGTGLGKSIVSSRILRGLVEANLLSAGDSFNPQPALIVCPKGIKIQWTEVLTELGLNKLATVVTYGELANAKGGLYLSWVTGDSSDDHAKMPVWDPEFLPRVVVWDECQFIRKATAQRTAIARALPKEVKVILMSATPFQTVEESRTVLELLGTRGWTNVVPACRETSAYIARELAYPSAPSALVQASMERLRKYLTEGPAAYQVEAPHARYPTKCSYTITTFELTEKQYRWYTDSFNRYIEEKRKRDEGTGMSDLAAVMVAINKLFEGAEILSARTLCRYATESVSRGNQVIIAHCHKLTRQQVLFGLQNKFSFDMTRVGSISGDQTPEQNQAAKLAFNNGQLDILTLAAGAGAEGLNLAHNTEAGRPRAIICPPWWSAIKLAQVLGRIHRIDSLSDCEVTILYPARTIFTEKVMPRVALRLKCLKAAALAKESWMSLLDAESSEDGTATAEATGDSEEEVDDTSEALNAEDVEIKVDERKEAE